MNNPNVALNSNLAELRVYSFDLVYITPLGYTFQATYVKTLWTVEQEIAIFAKQNPWAIDRPPSVENFRVVQA